MYVSQWKKDLLNEYSNNPTTIQLNIQDRIAEEVSKGFDSKDEMKEVFLEIADECNVGPNVVWGIFMEGDW